MTIAAALAVGSAVAVASMPAHAAATAHFVDCSAKTNGSGASPASPWNSLSSVNARVFGPGDHIYFRRGVTCTGQLRPRGSGTANAPITIAGYGGAGRPVIAGNGLVSTSTTPAATVFLDNVQGWEIRELEVTNSAATVATRSGIEVHLGDFGTGTHYLLDDVYVHNVSGDDSKSSNGVTFVADGGSKPTKFDDVTVQNSTIADVGREGLTTMSSWSCRIVSSTCPRPWTPNTHVVFKHDVIHDINGDGVVIRVSSGAAVENNLAYNIWMHSAGNNAGLWSIDSDNTVFQFNEVHHVHRPGLNDGEAFDTDGNDHAALFQYNYTHDNAGGFLLLCGSCAGAGNIGQDAIARYNLSRNDGSRLVFTAGQNNAQIYNNTFYLPPGSTTNIIEANGTGATHVTWSDNIFDNQGSGGYVGSNYVPSDYTWRGNIFYGHHPANEPSDPSKITSDPRLANPATGTAPTDFVLTAGSPALHSGVVIAGNGGRDYFGHPVPPATAPDRGFDEAPQCQ